MDMSRSFSYAESDEELVNEESSAFDTGLLESSQLDTSSELSQPCNTSDGLVLSAQIVNKGEFISEQGIAPHNFYKYMY